MDVEARPARRQGLEANHAARVDDAAANARPANYGVWQVLRHQRIPSDSPARRRERLPTGAAVLVVDHRVNSANHARNVFEIFEEGEDLGDGSLDVDDRSEGDTSPPLPGPTHGCLEQRLSSNRDRAET